MHILNSIIGGSNYIAINKNLIIKLGIVDAYILSEVIEQEGKTPTVEWIQYDVQQLSNSLLMSPISIDASINNLKQIEIIEMCVINGVTMYKTNEKKIFELIEKQHNRTPEKRDYKVIKEKSQNKDEATSLLNIMDRESSNIVDEPLIILKD